MNITDIRIRKIFRGGALRAIVSVTFDHQLAVHDVKVISARGRYFIVMPSRKNPDETYRDIVHPINADFRGMLEDAIIAAYDDAILKDNRTEDTAEDPLFDFEPETL